MNLWSKRKQKAPKDNRANILIAVIFLLTGMIVFRLYNLQISKYDLYSALASSQHQAFSELDPDRGKIFINNSPEGEGDLFPLATNKDFALVYVKPKEIEEDRVEEIADRFYEILNSEEVAEEINKGIKEEQEKVFQTEIGRAHV